MPNGKLIGFYKVPYPQHRRFKVLSLSHTTSPVYDLAAGAAQSLPTQTVELEPVTSKYNGFDVPTLQLVAGKRSWLNEVPGFRRL